MPDSLRRGSRRRARTRSAAPVGTLLLAAVSALAVLAVGIGIWMALASHAHSTVPAKATSPRPGASVSASSGTPTRKPAKVASSTTAPATSTSNTVAPTAADVTAAAASTRAARKAAVPFPGAPALPASTKSINHLNPKHKYIAITLDDGYGFQPKMLDLLEKYDARCTTFLIGSWAAQNKSVLSRLNKDGFEIANHTWDHKTLTKLSATQIASELTKTQTVISSVTGNQAPYLRPPGGASNAQVHEVAAAKGYRVVMWNRTFGDSGRGATPKKLYENVMSLGGPIKAGDIVLCHWGSKPSYEAMKRLLPELKAQGFEIVTVSELIADSKTAK